ncbi:MAG: hypothetical protein FWD74_12180, partial [Actinomycetia bacterium]|nr:hypothetical protein [Actinomycetes bacterium]
HACGAVADAPRDLVDELAARLAAERGFVLDRAHFTVFGQCRDCQGADRQGADRSVMDRSATDRRVADEAGGR